MIRLVSAVRLKSIGRAMHALGAKAISALSYLTLVIFLPLHAFFTEGHHSDEMRASVQNFASSFVATTASSALLAVGAFGALAVVGHDAYKRLSVRDRYSKAVDLMNEYMQLFDATLDSSIRPVFASEDVDEDQYKEVKNKINALLVDMCNTISSTFEKITGQQCCVTLKTFDADTGKVSTTTRDQRQESERKLTDKKLRSFDYTENSAFRDIVDRRLPSYVSNWLALLWLTGYYTNQNDEWLRHYSATAVVPLFVFGDNGDTKVIGFLCVDNFAGRFPKAVSRALLQSYASRAHMLLEILGKTRRE